MLLIFRYPHRGLVAPSSHQMQVFVEQVKNISVFPFIARFLGYFD